MRRRRFSPYVPQTLSEFSEAELDALIVYDGLSPAEIHHILTCDCDCGCEVCHRHSKLLLAHNLRKWRKHNAEQRRKAIA